MVRYWICNRPYISIGERIMSLITFVIGLGLGWFISNLVTAHQIADMSPSEVEELKREVDYLVENDHL